MDFLNSYRKAWASLWKYRWVILFLYLINLVVSLLSALPFTQFFKVNMEHSELLTENEFSIAAILEFLINHGDGIEALSIVVLPVIIFYFLFGVYTNASILYSVVSKNAFVAIRPFLVGGFTYFWKILRLSLYYILAIILAGLLVRIILIQLGINILEEASDLVILLKVKWGLVVLVVFVICFSIIKQYSKLFIAVKNSPFITAALLNGTKFFSRNLLQTFALFLLNLAVFILVMVLYVNGKRILDQNLWLITFLLAQFLMLFKISFRIIHLHSCFELYLKKTKSVS